MRLILPGKSRPRAAAFLLAGVLAFPAAAGAAKDDRWHRHSAFGWAVNGYGSYEIREYKGNDVAGRAFGIRLLCTPIREDRAAFDFAAGADAAECRGDYTYYVFPTYGDIRVLIWTWGPLYLQAGAGFTWVMAKQEGFDTAFYKRNVGTSYFAGPAFQLSPAFAVVPEWRWDNLPFGAPEYLRGPHRSWRVFLSVN
jgi:hypothetical protein